MALPHKTTPRTVIENDELTAAYSGAASSAIEAQTDFINQITILARYTTGTSETGTTCDIQLQISDDGTNWHTYAVASYSSGVLTLTDIDYRFGGGAGDTEYNSAAWQIPMSAKYYRVRAKENGSPSNAGTVTINVLESVV